MFHILSCAGLTQLLFLHRFSGSPRKNLLQSEHLTRLARSQLGIWFQICWQKWSRKPSSFSLSGFFLGSWPRCRFLAHENFWGATLSFPHLDCGQCPRLRYQKHAHDASRCNMLPTASGFQTTTKYLCQKSRSSLDKLSMKSTIPKYRRLSIPVLFAHQSTCYLFLQSMPREGKEKETCFSKFLLSLPGMYFWG